jgi:putative FmdB family regulatory protein
MEDLMPVYEYTCQACNAKFDRLVRSMTAADGESRPKCPACGSDRTARALSVFAVSSGSSKGSSAADVPMCGRCGGPPGSCAME